jgi:hypothetical protein
MSTQASACSVRTQHTYYKQAAMPECCAHDRHRAITKVTAAAA